MQQPDTYTVNEILCLDANNSDRVFVDYPDYKRLQNELSTLRTRNAELQERIRVLEGKNDGFSDLTDLMQKSLEEDTARISELSDENKQLRAALVKVKEAIEHPDALAFIDAILSGQQDGPGEEDGPWAEGWNERVGQPVEDPPTCDNCGNRGKINGLSQETFCDYCSHQRYMPDNWSPK